MRRISVRLSASPTGASPFLSSSARMNASMGDFTHAAFFTAGGVCVFGGTNAQKVRPFSMSTSYFLVTAAFPSRGSGAPIFTHASKSARTLSGSLPFGGIAVSLFLWLRPTMSGLRAELPGMMLGPLSPPLRNPSRVSSDSPPLIFSASAEWHE